MLGLIEYGSRTTKRDIFYLHFCDSSSQEELDSLVAVIVAMVQVPRLLLGVVATLKGLVMGDLKYTNSEDVLIGDLGYTNDEDLSFGCCWAC